MSAAQERILNIYESQLNPYLMKHMAHIALINGL